MTATPYPATPYPITTILPGATRVVDAVAMAANQGAGLWLTDQGRVVIAPQGRPGWMRLPLKMRRAAA